MCIIIAIYCWAMHNTFVCGAIGLIHLLLRDMEVTLRPRQNRRHFTDDIFKCIFLNENVWFPVEISLKFVAKGPINNITALAQIMAWRREGDKPLSEPMMFSLLMHICVIRPQWVNKYIFKPILWIDALNTSCGIGIRWVPENLLMARQHDNRDQCHHMLPLGHKGLIHSLLSQLFYP